MSALTIHLSSWLPRRPASLALILLLLAGCTQVKPGPEPPAEERHDDLYARVDLDELLNFGASLSGKSASERAEKEHTMCDDLRVAGGPDVLSKSAAPSQAETKHKATEPA